MSFQAKEEEETKIAATPVQSKCWIFFICAIICIKKGQGFDNRLVAELFDPPLWTPLTSLHAPLCAGPLFPNSVV